MARLTDALDVPWYAMNGSCHLNRETEKLVAEAGFRWWSPSGGWPDCSRP